MGEEKLLVPTHHRKKCTEARNAATEPKFLDRSERKEIYSNGSSLSGNALDQCGTILSGNSLEQTTTVITDDDECNRVIKSRIGTNDETREQILKSSKAKRSDRKVEHKVVETNEQIEQRVNDRGKKGKENKENKMIPIARIENLV